MDEATFAQEVCLQLIGAGAAGFLTIAFGVGAVLFDRWRREVNQLNALLSFMSKRRALSRPRSLKRQLIPRFADVDRCLRSVLAIRDEAQHARNTIRGRSRQLREVDELIRICNVYADKLQRDPQNYRRLLAELQHLLEDIAKNIAREGIGVSYVSPGSAAL